MEKNTNEKIEYFDLTAPQENIWLTEQLNPNTTINNVYGTFFINKSLDLDILKKAINKIIENNNALRIRIDEINSKPVQYIANYEYDDLPVYFLDNDNKDEIDSIINTIGLEHMNIINNKLYDLRLISTPTSVYVCIKMHHIIADAWSMGQIFIENIQKYYTEIEENRIVDIQTSYLDYVKRTEEYKKSEKYSRDMQFWQKYVKNISYEPQFELIKNKKNKRIIKSIDSSLHNKINTFCEKNNISEFAFFLGIISIYFSKLFDQENIVIGTPFLNRQKSQKELEIMGMFVATLPISIKLTRDINFMDLCKQITTTNLSCFKHSRFPYSEIQKEYINISEQNTNLYEIAFSYQVNNLENSFDAKLYKTTWLPNSEQITPLVVSYVNHFGEHEICYDYLVNLFNEEDINNIHDRFITIINQILKNNEISIQNIKILSPNDIELLQQFNNTGNITLDNETIVSRFKKIVQKNKTKVALKYNDIEMTYKELDQKSNSVANCIIKQKIKKGSPISIIFDKSIEMFITMLGIMKAGCYYIPILPEEEQKRAEFIVKNSESVLLITQEKYSTQIRNNIIQNQLVINDLLNGNTSDPNINNIKPTDLCYLIYTSGSTGTPKGVMLKHENIISLITSLNHHEDLKFLPNDIAISLLKYSFDASAIDIYSTLLNGGKLIVVPKSIELNPHEVCKIIESEHITRFFTVSKWIEQIQNISKNQKIDLKCIRLIGTGGEVLKPEKFKYLYETYPNLKFCNTYGPTESTVLVTSHLVNEKNIDTNSSPIGALIPFSRALVMNYNNEILPVNSKGELVVLEDDSSIHNISNGYFKLDSKTKEHFIKFINPCTNKLVNGYRTGDTVKINKDLELEFLGRTDDFKKVNGGYLVSLTEIETRIQNVIGNSFDISVVSIPIRNTNAIILFVSKKSETINITISDIKDQINKNLTFYMRPKQIIEIDALPFTNNGKVNKKLLEGQAIEYFNNKTNLLQPTNKTEQKIYDIIREIVNFDFSITDDFEDDLGIDSLNMAILYSKLNNIKISIQDLYNYPTVKDLAYLLKKEFSDNTFNTTPDIKIQNASNKMDLSNILLTGTTGFVGSHLLRELSENDSIKKIYCIVRQKLNLSSEERFENIINTYFDEETCKKIKKKCVILNGDLRKENLGLEEKIYSKVFKDVKTIINTAANVKHLGKYSTFHTDNIETVNNLINLCLKFDISLAHISTLSLNGYNNGNIKEIFTENTLNINQTFNKNPYLISKYGAEKNILKNISENNLNAKIFRVGNIMPRISDGKFQINYDQNGFLLAINALSNLKVISNEILNSKICLTPVDDCCKAIFEILNADYCNTIYHIEHDKKVKISSIIDIFKERNISFSNIDLKLFEKKINDKYSIGIEYLKSITDTNINKYNNSTTLEILQKLNFNWKPIKKDYLENIINISMKIK